MLKSDVKLLQAIANLQGNPDFDRFHEWVTDSYKELARLFVLKVDNSDSQHRIEQGRALNCYHIKTVIETARQQLQIAKEGEKKHGGNNLESK